MFLSPEEKLASIRKENQKVAFVSIWILAFLFVIFYLLGYV